jgi:hypothetical protein
MGFKNQKKNWKNQEKLPKLHEISSILMARG